MSSYTSVRRTSSLFTGDSAIPDRMETTSTADPQNPMKANTVPHSPDDTVQSLKFNPVNNGMPMLLASGSWDHTVRVWQVSESGAAEPRLMQNVGAPILEVDWFDDSTKIFMACADNKARVWDLVSNQVAVVGTHDKPIRSCHWITAPTYSCLMTTSFDKTIRFWDMRQPPTQSALKTINVGHKIYCSDALYPMAVVGLSNRHCKVYNLDGGPQLVKDVGPLLEAAQLHCLAIFKDKVTNQPMGFAKGCIKGKVKIEYIDSARVKDNFDFNCHRSTHLVAGYEEIYPVNALCFHPIHNTLVSGGADGRFNFWDKDAHKKLKASEVHPMPVTALDIHGGGNWFAYATGYDWSKGHEANVIGQGSKIFLLKCEEDLRPWKK